VKISDHKKLNSSTIKNIIFDWGGVITNLDFETFNLSFKKLGINNSDDWFSTNHRNTLFTDFEVAKISPEMFREGIKSLSTQELTFSEIDEAWNSLLGETPMSRINILKNLGKKYRIFLLSNTNSIHANFYNNKLRTEYQTDHSVLFEWVFYSHEVGIRKPEKGIFEYVIRTCGLLPQESLYIDDTEIHVNAAASVGMNAFHLAGGMDIVDLFKDW
jgi:glucose-1-phosphatase